MRITTDNKWKPFRYQYEIPRKVLLDQFDYHFEDCPCPAGCDECNNTGKVSDILDGYFQYRGYWYHVDMFMRFNYPGPFGETDENGYHGYHGDSYFSGVLLKMSEDV